MRKTFTMILMLISISLGANLWWNTFLGKYHYGKENYEKALENFDSAIVADPQSHEAHYNRALALTQLGRIEEANKVIAALEFDDEKKKAQLAYTEARQSEELGDQAVKQQDVSNAYKAYDKALKKYVEALDANPKHAEALRNVESVGTKLANLPEPPEDQQNQNSDQNQDQQDEQDQQDNENQNDDQQNGDQDAEDKENEDQQDKQDQDEEKDGQEDENDQQDDEEKDSDEENKDQQNEKDREDNKQDDKEKEDENAEQDSPQPEQPDSVALNAMQLLEKYADDANDLNKPPVGKAQPVAGGKDW